MRKLLPLFVVSILVLGGLGTIAIPIEKPTRLDTQIPLLEINVKGGILGYKATIKNVANETINGTINMTITTNTLIIPIGSTLTKGWSFGLTSSSHVTTFLRPLIGLGRINITVAGEVVIPNHGTFQYFTWATGFVFVIYVSCTVPTIPIP